MRRVAPLLLVITAGATLSAQNWPSFRGTNAAGVADAGDQR
jgi:hypothetical protein